MKIITLKLTETQEKTLITILEERLWSFNHLLLTTEAIKEVNNDNMNKIKKESVEYFAQRIQNLEELLTIIKKAPGTTNVRERMVTLNPFLKGIL